MFSCFTLKSPISVNKSLREYCKKTQETSIKNIIERNKEKSTVFSSEDDDCSKDSFKFYGLIGFLSLTTLYLLFYKKFIPLKI